jgi:hypothetical protein
MCAFVRIYVIIQHFIQLLVQFVNRLALFQLATVCYNFI